MNINEEKIFLNKQLQLGIEKLNRNIIKEAIEYFNKIISIRPNHSQTINLIGICYLKLKEYNFAIEYFEKAISIDPNQEGYYINLGNTFKELKKFKLSLETYEKGLKLNINKSLFLNQIGLLYFSFQKYQEAKEYFVKSIALDENNYQSLNNLGQLEYELSNFNLAKEYYNKSLSINNLYNIARYNLGLCLIREGNFEEGWKNYEYRENKNSNLDITENQKEWDGSTKLHNKCLLIICEQGIGDNIQFLRYIKLINKDNTKIILLLKKNLTSLIASVDNVDKILVSKNDIPKFDYYIYLLSLPNIFSKKNIPEPLNIFNIDVKLLNKWNKYFSKYRDNLNVGICWQGDSINNSKDYKRSIHLKHFEAILNIPNINYYSLQKHEGINQLKEVNTENLIIFDENYDQKPFADTLCIIQNLDLIISVDTSIAHIAATMEKNTWILLSKACDYRWGINDKTTKWYKKVKLFRQTELNQWDEVINNLKKHLLIEKK